MDDALGLGLNEVVVLLLGGSLLHQQLRQSKSQSAQVPAARKPRRLSGLPLQRIMRFSRVELQIDNRLWRVAYRIVESGVYLV